MKEEFIKLLKDIDRPGMDKLLFTWLLLSSGNFNFFTPCSTVILTTFPPSYLNESLSPF